jgi:hypothetical protein
LTERELTRNAARRLAIIRQFSKSAFTTPAAASAASASRASAALFKDQIEGFLKLHRQPTILPEGVRNNHLQKPAPLAPPLCPSRDCPLAPPLWPFAGKPPLKVPFLAIPHFTYPVDLRRELPAPEFCAGS